MRTIYKYPLQVADRQFIDMPFGAKVLSAQMQDGNICLWADVDTDNTKSAIEVAVFGTGHPIDPVDYRGFEYLDTVQPHAGLVFHVYIRCK